MPHNESQLNDYHESAFQYTPLTFDNTAATMPGYPYSVQPLSREVEGFGASPPPHGFCTNCAGALPVGLTTSTGDCCSGSGWGGLTSPPQVVHWLVMTQRLAQWGRRCKHMSLNLEVVEVEVAEKRGQE